MRIPFFWHMTVRYQEMGSFRTFRLPNYKEMLFNVIFCTFPLVIVTLYTDTSSTFLSFKNAFVVKYFSFLLQILWVIHFVSMVNFMDKQDNFKSASNVTTLICIIVQKYHFTIKIPSAKGQLSLQTTKYGFSTVSLNKRVIGIFSRAFLTFV